MANGVSATLANSWLDALCNATAYSETNTYAKLHTADPGAAGTTAASVETTRKLLSFAAASGGAISLDTTASWTSWPVGANGETISDVSVWDDVSTGNFLYSANLAANKTLNTGDTFNLTNITITFTVAS
jgi:hypothetical protein